MKTKEANILIVTAQLQHQNTDKIIQLLLDKGANINAQPRHNVYVLTSLIRDGENIRDFKMSTLELLLNNGANPNIKDGWGETPLIFTTKKGNKELVKGLLKYKANVTLQDNNGLTALSHAIMNNHTELIELLKNAGAKEQDVKYFLLPAIIKEDLVTVKKLINKGTDVNIRTEEGATPLIIAAKKGNYPIVKTLLENSADTDAQDNYSQTALMLAAGNGYFPIVKILLDHGANLDIKDKYNNTALCRAISQNNTALCNTPIDRNYIDTVKELLQKGADVNIYNKYDPHICTAATYGDTEIVKELLNHGLDVNLRGLNNRTALMMAAMNGYINIVNLLIKHGADVNAKDNDGKTALMYAIPYEHTEVVKELLTYKANVNLKYKNNETMLTRTKRLGYTKIIRLLEKAGAK